MERDTIRINGLPLDVGFSVDDDGDIEELTKIEVAGVDISALLDFEDIRIAIEDALILNRVVDKRLAEEDIAESRYYTEAYA